MAELTHFYEEENDVVAHTQGSAQPIVTILGSSLTANTKYLIVARCLWGVDSATNKGTLQVSVGNDDATIVILSRSTIEFEQTGSTDLHSYFFVRSYRTDASPSDVELESLVASSSTVSVDQASLFVLDLDAITDEAELGRFYFDASDAGPTDAGAEWTGDANAFDGSESTFAQHTTGTGALTGDGTTAPTSGASISDVRTRVQTRVWNSFDYEVREDDSGGAVLVTEINVGVENKGWSAWVSLTAPAGGWTWQKVNDLHFSCDDSDGNGEFFKAEVQVLGDDGLGYVEDINTATGTEFADDGATPPDDWTDLATIPAADLLADVAPLETGYFDASDAGPIDVSTVWTDDANAFDGDSGTFAFSSADGGALTGDGTTVSTSGATIGAVTFQVTYSINGGAQLLGGWNAVDPPSGGWTWQKVNDLSLELNTNNDLLSAEIKEDSTAGASLGFWIQPAFVATPEEARIVEVRVYGTDANVPYLIFGSARIGIGSTGRFFRTEIRGADVAASIATLGVHQAEGEDTSELRNAGYAIRHEATTATDVIIRAQEEAASGNMTDEGSYLIALPTALFADLEYDYESGQIAFGTTETTIATSGSYTPTVTGNHLVIGLANNYVTSALTQMWVDSTTTEIRTGDSTPTHNQLWDTGKDEEQQITFQRYSITTAETLNLQADGGILSRLEHRWLLVVNLNPPSTAAVYPPFPRHPSRRIRM